MFQWTWPALTGCCSRGGFVDDFIRFQPSRRRNSSSSRFWESSCVLAANSRGVQPGQMWRPLGFCSLPPIEQHRKTLLLRLDGPIELRRKVIHPAVRQPFARISVKFGVSVESFDLRRISRAPDAERADAEFHPRLRRLDGLIDAADESVHVLAPPVVAAQFPPTPNFFQLASSGKSSSLPPSDSLYGIEIIVEVNAIHVVALDDVHDDAQRIILHFLFAGIEPEIFAVAPDECGSGFADVVRRDWRLGVRMSARDRD